LQPNRNLLETPANKLSLLKISLPKMQEKTLVKTTRIRWSATCHRTRRQSPSVGASRQEIIDSAARATLRRKDSRKRLKAAEALRAKEHPEERQGGLLGLVKRKPKSEMKMFVHPPDVGERSEV
jgi:hypothetical protein